MSRNRMMKKTAALILGILCVVAPAFAGTEAPWELRKDKEGIKVFTRPVQGSSILEFKAEMTVDAPLDRVLELYDNADRFPEWFYQCMESRLLERRAEEGSLVYFVLDMPWPVSDRDAVYARSKSTEANGDIVFHLQQKPGAYPEQPGRVRVPYLTGGWRFHILSEKQTAITYQQHSEAGGHIPSALVNKLAVNIPFHTLRNFRELLAREQTD